jgi:hypothetical protein
MGLLKKVIMFAPLSAALFFLGGCPAVLNTTPDDNGGKNQNTPDARPTTTGAGLPGYLLNTARITSAQTGAMADRVGVNIAPLANALIPVVNNGDDGSGTVNFYNVTQNELNTILATADEATFSMNPSITVSLQPGNTFNNITMSVPVDGVASHYVVFYADKPNSNLSANRTMSLLTPTGSNAGTVVAAKVEVSTTGQVMSPSNLKKP